jgi:hypothetical protein
MAQRTSLSLQIGIGVLILTLLVLLALILVSMLQMPTSTAAPSVGQAQTRRNSNLWRSSESNLALEDAVQRGEARAHQWAQDAQLVRAEAAWRPGVEGWKTENPALTWSFYFYSPARGTLATVAVKEEQVFWVPPTEIPSAPTTLSTFPPQHGVDVAWLSFRAAGGEDLLRQYPTAMVTFRLQQQGEAPVWTVSLLRGETHLNVVVDAQTGAVLPSTESPNLQ